MQKKTTLALTHRLLSTEQQNMKKKGKNMKKILGAGMVALVICGAGTMDQAFAGGQRIRPENVVGINILGNETNFIVDLSLCGGTQGTYLHVPISSPLHDRVFAAWNMAVLNGNNMNVWWSCRIGDTVHADLTLFGVDQ